MPAMRSLQKAIASTLFLAAASTGWICWLPFLALAIVSAPLLQDDAKSPRRRSRLRVAFASMLTLLCNVQVLNAATGQWLADVLPESPEVPMLLA